MQVAPVVAEVLDVLGELRAQAGDICTADRQQSATLGTPRPTGPGASRRASLSSAQRYGRCDMDLVHTRNTLVVKTHVCGQSIHVGQWQQEHTC